MLKYNYLFRLKYAKAILSNNTRKPLWFEITKMLIAVYETNIIVSSVSVCESGEQTFKGKLVRFPE